MTKGVKGIVTNPAKQHLTLLDVKQFEIQGKNIMPSYDGVNLGFNLSAVIVQGATGTPVQSRWLANANGGELEALGYRRDRVDVDVPDSTWAKAASYLKCNLYFLDHIKRFPINAHFMWWAPAKFDPVKSPMLFFEKDKPVIPPVQPNVGLDMVLKHIVIQYVEKTARPGSIKLFRTQSPRHFEGVDWDQGGSCQRLQPLLPEQVEELFSVQNNGTNVEARLVNQHLYKALKGSDFQILDITHMSEFRADAHPSTAGGKKHNDCMHWCLPGITDT
ncbi:protein trichome birefringence-like 13 [Citrus sinensis]|uniref:Protein trichome birefringence-like 13 n=1 Tax=Citrus sinensis TaxID=2711 RepID=A0ACB8ID70_CITSI|nr:protein trichome birefringence-like 13 [Citrus sinensis]